MRKAKSIFREKTSLFGLGLLAGDTCRRISATRLRITRLRDEHVLTSAFTQLQSPPSNFGVQGTHIHVDTGHIPSIGHAQTPLRVATTWGSCSCLTLGALVLLQLTAVLDQVSWTVTKMTCHLGTMGLQVMPALIFLVTVTSKVTSPPASIA